MLFRSDGWQLIEKENENGIIPANGTANASFTNKYVPGTTTVQLMASKTIDGMSPEEGLYTFQLKQNGQVIEEASNNAAGTILFNTLVFTQPGEYTYTISEVRGNDSTITYDTHEETIIIQVTDDGTGQLVAQTNYDTDGAKFKNETKKGSLIIKKETDGQGNPNEEFEFKIRLTDEFGQSLDSVYITKK